MFRPAQVSGGINAAACQVATIVEGPWVAEAGWLPQSQMTDADDVSGLDGGLEIVRCDAHTSRDGYPSGLNCERLCREVERCSVRFILRQPQHLPLKRDWCRAQMMGDMIRR